MLERIFTQRQRYGTALANARNVAVSNGLDLGEAETSRRRSYLDNIYEAYAETKGKSYGSHLFFSTGLSLTLIGTLAGAATEHPIIGGILGLAVGIKTGNYLGSKAIEARRTQRKINSKEVSPEQKEEILRFLNRKLKFRSEPGCMDKKREKFLQQP